MINGSYLGFQKRPTLVIWTFVFSDVVVSSHCIQDSPMDSGDGSLKVERRKFGLLSGCSESQDLIIQSSCHKQKKQKKGMIVAVPSRYRCTFFYQITFLRDSSWLLFMLANFNDLILRGRMQSLIRETLIPLSEYTITLTCWIQAKGG